MTDQAIISIPINTSTSTNVGSVNEANYNVARIVGMAAIALTLNVVAPSTASSHTIVGNGFNAGSYPTVPNSTRLKTTQRKRKIGINNDDLSIFIDNTGDNEVLSKIQSTSSHMITLQQRVESFYDLSDDWDGYGGDAPDQETINNVFRFLRMIPGDYINNLSEYRLAPTSYGTVVIEWDVSEQDFFHVEIGYDQIAYFYEIEGEKGDSGENIQFNSNDYLEDVLATLGKLYPTAVA